MSHQDCVELQREPLIAEKLVGMTPFKTMRDPAPFELIRNRSDIRAKRESLAQTGDGSVVRQQRVKVSHLMPLRIPKARAS